MKFPSFLTVCVSFFSLVGVQASQAFPIREVELPPSVKASVSEMYGITRGEADCCGVSSIRLFRVEEKMDRRAAVEDVLRRVAKQDSSVDWLLRNPIPVLDDNDEAGRYWDLDSTPERYSLRDFLFGPIRAFKGLAGQCDRASKEVGAVLGTAEVDLLVHEDIFPAPNVDGNVEVSMTPDGKYLVVVVSDYGA